MDFIFGMFTGIGIGLIIGSLITEGIPSKPNADKHVDNLNTQAQKNLQKLQENQNKIAQVSQKADTAHRDLKTKIAELAHQD